MSEVHVLVVEDEVDLAGLMADYLKQEGFKVTCLHSGAEVVEQVQKNVFDVVLLDLMLPAKNGIEICREVRRFSDVPIIMTTAKVTEIDRILGLELGANDYVCKPYSPRELVARVKVQLRGAVTRPGSDLGFSLHRNELLVEVYGAKVSLTLVEFNLLEKLHSQPARVFNRDQLMDAVYADGRVVSDRTIDSHIKKIRHKLKQHDNHDFVQAVYGCGYKYVPKP